jgi:hypothetical protein
LETHSTQNENALRDLIEIASCASRCTDQKTLPHNEKEKETLCSKYQAANITKTTFKLIADADKSCTHYPFPYVGREISEGGENKQKKTRTSNHGCG